MTQYIQYRGEYVRVQDGVVSVLDDVAGHYSTCHSFTPAQEQECRNLASAKPAKAVRQVSTPVGWMPVPASSPAGHPR